MNTFLAKAVKAEILESTSMKMQDFTGQVVPVVFELNKLGVPQRFYLSHDGIRADYRSGVIVGAHASAFDPSVLEVATCGPTIHHLRIVDADTDLGFIPKTCVPGGTGLRWAKALVD